MTIWYIDLTDGDDSTGDGSSANPYKTMNKVHSVGANGDECRIAKTEEHTKVFANFTFTVNSTAVTVDSDVTGSLSVGDYIGTPNMTGNGESIHSAYRITAISYFAPTTTITIETDYYNGQDTFNIPSTATEIVAYVNKINFATTGTAGANAVTTSRTITHSGGWNLATETRDGYTWMTDANARTTSTYQFFDVNNTSYFEYLNILDCYYIIDNTPNATSFTNCHLIPYGAFHKQGNSGILNWTNVSFRTYGAFTYPIIRQTSNDFTLTNCWLLNGRGKPIHSTGDFFYNNVKIYGWLGLHSLSPYSYNYEFNDVEFWYCTEPFHASPNQYRIEAVNFYFCTYGYLGGTSGAGYHIINCGFYGCSYAIRSQHSTNTIVDSCVFNNNSYDVYTDQYSGPVKMVNCTHENPKSYSVYNNTNSGTISIIDPILIGDLNSINRFIYKPTTANQNSYPAYLLQNVDSYYYPNGQYYGYFTITEGSIVNSSYPSMVVQNKVTTSRFTISVPILCTYAPVGVGKRIKVYLKFNESWTGQVDIEAKLNSGIVKKFTSLTPANISTNWVEYIFDVEGSLIQSDGVLELCIIPNGNTVLWTYDDIRVENL